jgi:hypothetical protein
MIPIALVACNAAGAAPTPGSGPHPMGWKQLPAIARAVGAAATADGVTVDAVDAWGEPARGCYGVWLELRGGSAEAPALADQILGGLPVGTASRTRPGEPGAPRPAETPEIVEIVEIVEINDLRRPSGPDGVLAFQFARPPFRGRVRARLGHGRITATTCFFNQREPAACDAVCTGVLDAVAAQAEPVGSAR